MALYQHGIDSAVLQARCRRDFTTCFSDLSFAEVKGDRLISFAGNRFQNQITEGDSEISKNALDLMHYIFLMVIVMSVTVNSRVNSCI